MTPEHGIAKRRSGSEATCLRNCFGHFGLHEMWFDLRCSSGEDDGDQEPEAVIGCLNIEHASHQECRPETCYTDNDGSRVLDRLAPQKAPHAPQKTQH